MAFVPFLNITWISPLDETVLRSRLLEVIEPAVKPGERWIFDGRARPYEGAVTGSRFTVSRVTGYRNWFLPCISGSFEPADGKTIIKIKMRLPAATKLVAFLWLIAGVFALVSFVLSRMVPALRFYPAFAPAFFFTPAGYAVMTFLFCRESAASRHFFAELFAAAPPSPSSRVSPG
ncbi:MAG: hypothetical protein LBC88_09945 [Spirochaetaceae bacterium]|nr:hypothetical protein [Spirochaetaceae bacterium]